MKWWKGLSGSLLSSPGRRLEYPELTTKTVVKEQLEEIVKLGYVELSQDEIEHLSDQMVCDDGFYEDFNDMLYNHVSRNLEHYGLEW